MKSIGWIGVGIMGKPMVRNLQKAGYTLHIYARNREKVADVIQEGAIFHDTIGDCAQGRDAVITMVGFPKDVEEVYFAPGNILDRADPGTYLIDMTTTSPKLAQRIVLELKDKVAKGFAAGIDLENVAGAASDTAAAQGAGIGDQHAAGVQFQRVDAHGRQQAAGTALFPDDGRAAMAAFHIEHVGVEDFRLRQHGHVDRMGGLLPRAQGTAAVQQGASAIEGAPEGALALHLAAG